MRPGLKKALLREGIILLTLLGGGFLLVILDCFRSRHPVINTSVGTASCYYFPTILGEIGIIIVLLYPLYLIIRLIIYTAKKGLKKFTPLCLLIFISFFIAGCYEVQEEIISASQAVRIEGLPEIYYTYTLSARTGSNDYHFAKPAEKDSPAESGYARALPLKDNIYILQLKFDNYKNYLIMFTKLINNAEGKGKELRMVFPKEVIDPASYGVNLKVENLAMVTLTGDRKNILSFLKAYAAVNFLEQPPELSQIKDKISEAAHAVSHKEHK